MTANVVGTPPRPDAFDVIVFGSEHSDWLRVLSPGKPFWTDFPGVASVSHRRDDWRGDEGNDGTRQLVIPLLEGNMRSLRHACWRLSPSREALETLADKQAFSEHLDAIDLSDYLPKHFARPEDATFPAIVKPIRGSASFGVAIVNSSEQLAETIASMPPKWQPWLIQEYVEGPDDYSVHGLCVGGRIVWHQAYTFAVNPADPIRVPHVTDKPILVRTRAYDRMVMAQIVKSLRYDGPANFQYRIRKNGNAAFFEVNPRIGGSLFRQAGYANLRTMISLIIANATWHPATK